jgi:hypothetical protein
MVELADLLESATLVAVKRTLVSLLTFGAVKTPLDEIAPADAVQVTAVFDVLVTVA